jgi:hypothetical protein
MDSQPERPSEKARGHESLATFMDHDDSYLVFRRFRVLNLQVLLHLQQQIAELEAKLGSLQNPQDSVRQSYRLDHRNEVQQFLTAIEEKLYLYSPPSPPLPLGISDLVAIN